MELITGDKGGFPSNFKVFNDHLYFTADTNQFGVGTLEGTGELFRLNAAPKLDGFTAVIQPGESLVRSLAFSDPDDDDLTFEIVAGLNNGTATIVNGVLTYTPNNGFQGQDVLLVRASDGLLYSQNATIRISTLDNPNRISFTAATSDVGEVDGVARLTIQLDQPASTLISFNYTLSGDTIEENGNSESGVVTFVQGQQVAEILVYVRSNDRHQPGNQQIIVSLHPTLTVGLGPINAHIVTILDDDMIPEVAFTEPWKNVMEDNVVEDVVVGLSNPSDQFVTVNVSFFGGGGAIAGIDYLTESPITLTFAPGEVRKVIPVRILEDIIVENQESLMGQLSSATGANITSDPQKFRYLLFIQDDDKSTVSIGPANQLSQEGNTVSLTLTRTGGNLSLPLEVPFTFDSLSATWDSDVTSANGTSFFFPANVSQVTNLFNLIDDGTVDGFQSFTILLPTSSEYTLGSQAQASVAFYDVNSLTPKLTVSSSKVNERNFGSPNNRVVDVTVSLSAPSSDPVTVPIRVSDSNQVGYAKRGIDFTFDTSDFVFVPGQTSLTRPLTILNDLEVEASERIRLVIGNGQFIANANDLVAEIVIEDDDYGLTLSGLSEVNENAGSFTVTATLSAPAAVGTVFTLALGGTTNWRNEPRDVTFTGLDVASPTLIFNQGEQTKQFTVNVINDTLIERPETLSINAYRAISGTLEGVASYTVTINDDDRRPTAKFGPGNGFALASDSDVILIPIELDRATAVGARLTFNLHGTAKQNVDYQVVSGFVPGQLAIGALAVELGPTDTTAYIGIKPIPNNSTVDKTIKVTMVGAINIDLPPILPSTERRILATAPKPEPPVTNIKVGDLALETISLEPYSVVVSPGSGLIVGDNSDLLIINPLTLAININNSSSGLLHGSEVFFDSNFNGVRDFFDANENNRQDSGESLEPLAVTNRDGSFAIALSPDLDRNGSGVLEANEGRFVVLGGVDASTGLQWEIPLTSPAGTYGTTALSSVVEALVRRHGMEIPAAAERVADALDLPGYSMSGQNPIYQVLAGDALAEQVYVRQVQLAALTILASKFAQGLDANLVQSAFAVFDSIADQLSLGGSKANLADASFVRGVLASLNSRVLLPASPGLLNDSADLISHSIAHLNDLHGASFATPAAFLQQATRSKKVLYGPLASDLFSTISDLRENATANLLTEVPSAGTALADLQAMYSGQAFLNLVAAQSIGDVVPPVVGVQRSLVIEGDTGQSSTMTFEVTKLGDHGSQVSVAYRTLLGTAAENTDYVPTSGILTWEPGDSSNRFVNVTILGDDEPEGDEYLKLELYNPNGIAIRSSEGIGYILNDDAFVIALEGGHSSNFVSIAHSSSELTIAENDQALVDIQLTQPTQVSLSGSSSEATAFQLQLLDGSLRSDHYSILGSESQNNDSLHIVGLLSSVTVGGTEGSSHTLKMMNAEDVSLTTNLSHIDQLFSEAIIGSLQLRLGPEISQATIADADSSEVGTMIFTPVGGMLPMAFSSPDGNIVVVSFHSDLQLDTSDLDPGFVGSISVVKGGAQLSNLLVQTDKTIGSTVAILTTEDPLFLGSATFELVAGEGDVGNTYFEIEDGLLKVTNTLLGLSGTLPIRLRTTNATGESVEQVFVLTLEVVSTPGFSVTERDGSSTVFESGNPGSQGVPGRTDEFNVTLSMQPSSNVVLNISSGDTGEVTVSKSSLVFTPDNWNLPQTVTVTGVIDNVVDGNQTVDITIAVDEALSDDAFDPLADQTVSVTVVDSPNRPTVTSISDATSPTPTIEFDSVSGATGYTIVVLDISASPVVEVFRDDAIGGAAISYQIPIGAGLAVNRTYRAFLFATIGENNYSPAGGLTAPQYAFTQFTVGGAPTSPPAKPVASSTSGTANQPTIHWTASTDPTADYYSIYLINLNTGTLIQSVTGIVPNSFTPSNVLADGRYRIWVSATNSAGNSGFGAPYDFTVGTPVSVPSAPTGFAATSDNPPVISWNESAQATSYNVYLINRATNAVIASTRGLPQPNFTPAAALANGPYRIWVSSTNVAGTSPFSAPFDFVVGSALSVPGIPTGLSATNLNTSTPTITWNAVEHATMYAIWFINRDTGVLISSATELTTNSFTPSSPLEPGVNYRIWVRAYNVLGSSAFSSPLDFELDEPV